MPTAQTRIPTDRAERYLTQLCQHLNQISGHPGHGGGAHGGRAPGVRRVEYRADHGVIEFASGTCTLHATGDELTVELVAVDAHELRLLQQVLAARIEPIGRRDNLSLTW